MSQIMHKNDNRAKFTAALCAVVHVLSSRLKRSELQGRLLMYYHTLGGIHFHM